MNNLIKLLGSDAGEENADAPDDAIDESTPDNEGFTAAADEVFDALSSKDLDGFATALKTCIQMIK